MLIGNINTLQTVNSLYFADHEILYGTDTLDLQKVMRIYTTFGKFITGLQYSSVCDLDTGSVRDQVSLGLSIFGIGNDDFTLLLGILNRSYAAKFSQNSPNLLFMGHTGLGKTHLALAIADAVLEGGHDVLYTSAAALAAQLKDHSLARTYVCIVCGKIKDDSGTIDAPIGRHPADRKKMAVTEKNSRSAVTHWRVLERFSGYTLVECKLETGRTHQIRVHMAYRGHPILGDMVYGRKKPELGQDSQCLHAKELRFVHPRTGKPVTVSCELPDYFAALLEKLRSGYRRA